LGDPLRPVLRRPAKPAGEEALNHLLNATQAHPRSTQQLAWENGTATGKEVTLETHRLRDRCGDEGASAGWCSDAVSRARLADLVADRKTHVPRLVRTDRSSRCLNSVTALALMRQKEQHSSKHGR
jgi:hypothetical protein